MSTCSNGYCEFDSHATTKFKIMQIHCKKCGKDVTMETEFETRPPFKIINNHMCEAKRAKLQAARVKALQSGFLL